MFSFETSFQASRSSVLPFRRIEVKSPPVAHSHSAVINPEIPQPFMARLWLPHSSNTSFYTDPLWKQQFLSFEKKIIIQLNQEMAISLRHALIEIIRAEFEDITWSWSNASLNKDAIKSSSVFRANGVYDLCLPSGKALQHEMMGLWAKLGINTWLSNDLLWITRLWDVWHNLLNISAFAIHKNEISLLCYFLPSACLSSWQVSLPPSLPPAVTMTPS